MQCRSHSRRRIRRGVFVRGVLVEHCVGRLGSGPRLVGRIGTKVRVSVSFRQKYPPDSVLRCPVAAEKEVVTKGVVCGGEGLISVSGV